MLFEAAAAMATVPLSCHLRKLSQVFRQVFGDQDRHSTRWFVFFRKPPWSNKLFKKMSFRTLPALSSSRLGV